MSNSAEQLPVVGFIGLGAMGAPMAKNLLASGVPLVVHTRTADRAKELIAGGAEWARSPRAVALASEVVITMLPDSPEVKEVLVGEEGVLSVGPGSGLTWIDTSSIAPSMTRDLAGLAASMGVACLDAPVSGGVPAAVSGILSVMVGGEQETFERCEPILRRLGSQVTYVGETAAGQIAKLCNQMVVGCTIAAVAEALTMAGRLGIDPAVVREVMLGGFAQSKVLDFHGQRMLEGQYEPGFRATLHLKDMRNAVEAAAMSGSPFFMSQRVTELMERQVAGGGGDLDHSALFSVYAQSQVGSRP
jgi:2-hydroxy-3-oxopropionate reductase